MSDEEACGHVLVIDSEDIMQFGIEDPVMHTEPVELVCSRPPEHTPRNRHSDGVTDWEEVP